MLVAEAERGALAHVGDVEPERLVRAQEVSRIVLAQEFEDALANVDNRLKQPRGADALLQRVQKNALFGLGEAS